MVILLLQFFIPNNVTKNHSLFCFTSTCTVLFVFLCLAFPCVSSRTIHNLQPNDREILAVNQLGRGTPLRGVLCKVAVTNLSVVHHIFTTVIIVVQYTAPPAALNSCVSYCGFESVCCGVHISYKAPTYVLTKYTLQHAIICLRSARTSYKASSLWRGVGQPLGRIRDLF